MKLSELTEQQKAALEKKYKRERRKFFKDRTTTGLEAVQFKADFLKKNNIEQ